MRICVGVDAGQSSVDLAIGDERGRDVASARLERASFVGDGQDAAMRTAQFVALARETLDGAGIAGGSEAELLALVAGVSGYDEDDEASARHEDVERVRFLHDAGLAHAAAFGEGDGIVVIAGSGSVAYVRAGPQRLRTGGWGPVFGDRGSGFWLGRRAISAAMDAQDRAFATPLTALVCARLGSDSLRRVQREYALGKISGRRVAALAEPLLAMAAADPGGPADALASAAVSALWALVRQTAERLSNFSSWPVAPVGGLFRNAWFLERFERAAPAGFTVHLPQQSPAQAALRLAYRDAGLSFEPGSGRP